MMVMRCDEPYALRLRAHLAMVHGDTVRGLYAPIAGTKLVKLVVSFPESIGEQVIASATRWIEERAPKDKEPHLEERARR
jgi:hypothetical protein